MGKHSVYSASSATRWVNCPASIKLSEKAPVERDSPFALEGTVAHALAHYGLILQVDVGAFEDIVLDEISLFPVDLEMIANVKDYIALIAELSEGAIKVEFEKRIELKGYGDDLFGTCDCLIYKEDEILVIDFKYGKGISVDAEKNYQMMYYALGADKTFKAKKVRLIIFQPRDPYGSKIKEDVMSSKELVSFSKKIRQAVKASKEENPLFSVGKYCNFCPCISICPQLTEDALEVAKVTFSTDLETYSPPKVEELSSNRLTFILKLAKPLAKFLKEVEAYSIRLLEEGTEIGDEEVKYLLAEGRKTRVWVDEKAVIEAIEPFYGSEIYETALKSPAKIEKMEGGKNHLALTLHELINVRKGSKVLKQIKKEK